MNVAKMEPIGFMYTLFLFNQKLSYITKTFHNGK